MMMPKKILLVLCMLGALSSTGAAEEYAWRFEAGGDTTGWKALNASPERDAGGFFALVRQDDPFWLVSPQNLDVAAKSSYIEFRIKAPETYLLGYVVVKTRDNRSWREEFSLGLPDAFHVYRVDLSRGNRTGSPIDSVALAFGNVERVWIDYIRIYSPSRSQLLRIYWSDFWEVPFAAATTVNFVSTPSIGEYSFLAPLYGLLLFALCILALRWRARADCCRRALIIACVFAGTLFALRMDYTWYLQWRADQASLGRRSVDERISRVEGSGTYNFAKNVKQVIPAGSTVRIFAGILEAKVKYYLLPVKVSRTAPYIAVYKDPAISFDPVRKELKRDNVVVATNAQLLMTFGKDAFLYQSLGGGRP